MLFDSVRYVYTCLLNMSDPRLTVFGPLDADSVHKLACLYGTATDPKKVAETVVMSTGEVLRALSFEDRLVKVKAAVAEYYSTKQKEITSAYKLLAQNSGDISCLTGYASEVVQKASAIYEIFSGCKLDTEVAKMFAECGGDLELFHTLLQTNLEEFIHRSVFTAEFVSKQNADKHLKIPGILNALISSFKAIGVVMTWEKKDNCVTINLKYGKTKYDFKELLALASRGTHVMVNIKSNTVTSITRVKFFRPDEIKKQYGILSADYSKVFAIRAYKSVFAIKWDGTNMCILYDVKTQKYRAATLGVRLNNGDETTNGKQLMPGENDTYEEKALVLLNTYPELQKFLQTNPGTCAICELICPGTAVITKYAEESLQILYFQDESGKVFLNDESRVFDTNSECLRFMSENPKLCGTIVEGSVEFIQTGSNCFPVLKHKTLEYCNAKHETSNITGFSLQNHQKRLQAILDIFAEIFSTSITAVQEKYETSLRTMRDFVFECCKHFPKMIAEIQAQILEPVVPETPFMKAFVEKLTQIKEVANNTITDLDCIYLILGSSDKADAFLQYTNLMTFFQSLSPESDHRNAINQLDELIKAKQIDLSMRSSAISLCTGKVRSFGIESISTLTSYNNIETAKNMTFEHFYCCYYKVTNLVKSKQQPNVLLEQAIVSSACLEGLKKPHTSEPSAILVPVPVPAPASVLTQEVYVQQKIVVLDFDGTLASNPEINTVAGDKSALYDFLDDPKSIKSSLPYQTMISVVTKLKTQGDRIMILTGRKGHLKIDIQTWISTHFGIDVPEEDIICRKADTNVSTALFKAQYLAGFTSVNPDASIVFIDDAKENLAAVEKLCPHVNLLLAKEGIMYPYTGCSFGSSNKDAKQSTIVCLCGPPGTGKTTLVTQLIAAGYMTEEQWISHDKEKLKGNDDAKAWQNMQGQLQRSVTKYEITVLDTTCPDLSQLKKKFPGVNIVVVYTFSSVKLHTGKTMKKQQLEVLNGPYNEALNSFIINIEKRSLSSEPKTSTLEYEEATTTKIVKQIFDKCLAFREKNSDIPSMTALIVDDINNTIKELHTIIDIQTQESDSPASASPVSASPAFSYTPQKGTYTGAFFHQGTFDNHLRKFKIDESDISKGPSGNSHITFAYMPTEDVLLHSGTKVEFQLGQPISENCVTMIPVRFVGDHPPVASENPHITWFVGEGKSASDAGSIKVPADHLFLDTVYTGIVMLNLLGN